MAVALAMGPMRHETGSTQRKMYTAYNANSYRVQSTTGSDGDGVLSDQVYTWTQRLWTVTALVNST